MKGILSSVDFNFRPSVRIQCTIFYFNRCSVKTPIFQKPSVRSHTETAANGRGVRGGSGTVHADGVAEAERILSK